MKTKNIILCVIAIVIIVGGYFVWKHQQVQPVSNYANTTYTNAKYGYAIDINKNLTYQEVNEADGSGVGLMVKGPNTTSPYSQLSINVFAGTSDSMRGTPTTLNGLSATVMTGNSGGSQGDVSVKTYDILHNGLIYEINVIPGDEADFQATANTFRFTK
jgi:hypothetical protein